MNTLALLLLRGVALTALLWLSACTPGTLFAQKPFFEGILLYDVEVKKPEQPEGPATPQTKKGIYRLSIKREKVKKEFILENGKVTRTSIADYKTGMRQVLREREGALYVVETGLEAKKRKNSESAFTPSGQSKTLNGYELIAGTLRLESGKIIRGYVYPDFYLPFPAMLQRFETIHGIPAEFTLELSDGSMLQFELKSIREEPVLNATFSIPEDYRRISKEAYKKFKK